MDRCAGWRRMTLQVLFFGPEDIYNPDASFRAISNRVVVSPIVRKLVYNKVRWLAIFSGGGGGG